MQPVPRTLQAGRRVCTTSLQDQLALEWADRQLARGSLPPAALEPLLADLPSQHKNWVGCWGISRSALHW